MISMPPTHRATLPCTMLPDGATVSCKASTSHDLRSYVELLRGRSARESLGTRLHSTLLLVRIDLCTHSLNTDAEGIDINLHSAHITYHVLCVMCYVICDIGNIWA